MNILKTIVSALGISFVIFAPTPQAQAAVICVSGYSCDFGAGTSLGVAENVISAPGALPPVWLRPNVLQIIPFKDSSGWNYYFSVTDYRLTSFEVPYFDGWAASDAKVPVGWTYSIEPTSAGSPATIARWTRQAASSSVVGYTVLGAIFTSPLAPTTVQMKINTEIETFNEPLFVPLTLSAAQAGYLPADLSVEARVPLPTSLMLLLLGIGATRVFRKQT